MIELFCVTHPCISDNSRQTCCFKGHFPRESVSPLSQVFAHNCGKLLKKHFISAVRIQQAVVHINSTEEHPCVPRQSPNMLYGTAAVPKECRISESQVLDNTRVHSGTAVGIFHLYTPCNSGKKAD